jgi:hypothetical protein
VSVVVGELVDLVLVLEHVPAREIVVVLAKGGLHDVIQKFAV